MDHTPISLPPLNKLEAFVGTPEAVFAASVYYEIAYILVLRAIVEQFKSSTLAIADSPLYRRKVRNEAVNRLIRLGSSTKSDFAKHFGVRLKLTELEKDVTSPAHHQKYDIVGIQMHYHCLVPYLNEETGTEDNADYNYNRCHIWLVKDLALHEGKSFNGYVSRMFENEVDGSHMSWDPNAPEYQEDAFKLAKHIKRNLALQHMTDFMKFVRTHEIRKQQMVVPTTSMHGGEEQISPAAAAVEMGTMLGFDRLDVLAYALRLEQAKPKQKNKEPDTQ